MMRKWAASLETQRKDNVPRSSLSVDAVPQDFTWTRDHAGGLENPYLQQDDDDDEEYGPATAPAQFPVPPQSSSFSRTSSSSNVRQRSLTGESAQSLVGVARAPPPRFPMPPPAPLSLQTQSNGAPSPGSRGGDSYFSPIADSPNSSRASGASGVFPGPPYQFPKNGSQSGWDDNTRYTAPAMPRAPSRDGTPPNSYGINGRTTRGPSLPAMSTHGHSYSHSQGSVQQQRSRSYSTPDAHPGLPRQRQPSQGNVPAVPGIPQHLHDSNASRSQTSSPRNDLPIRSNNDSPGASRHHMHKHSGSLGGTMSQFPTQPIYPRQNTPGSQGSTILRVDSSGPNSRTGSPAIGSGPMSGADMPLPTQLKVRVTCDGGNYVTLVVAFNITYQSLIDRIDAKLARFMTSSIGNGNLKLRYQDEDGDFVTIESDDDIQIAFMEWREGVRNMYSGGVGEIELFCVGDSS